MGTGPRTKHTLAIVLVFIILAGLIIGLTVGLLYPGPGNDCIRVDPTTAPPKPDTTASPGPWPPSVTKSFRYAAVVTDTVPCSTIGADILGRGGSAVDAAIAAALCVGVVNPHSCGIGGGQFITGYEKPRGSDTREVFTILAREWAPIAATQDMYKNDTDAAKKGGLAIGVPGDVKGHYTAWERYGVLPWAELFAPVIRLCQEGFTVERSLASAIVRTEAVIRADPILSEYLLKAGDQLIQEGDILKNPKLAVTLAKIANDPHAFYNGSLADDIVADIQERGGIITKEDLQKYESKIKDPLKTKLSNGGYTIYSPPPPSSGIIYQFILNILNGYLFNSDMTGDTDDKLLAYHRIIEAFKFAYAERSTLGDEDFVNVTEILANLTSSTFAEGIRARINDSSTQDWRYYEPDFDITEDTGTAQLNVLTKEGSAVAITSTINLYFGSKVKGSRTGIMFNDEMDDFSIPGTSNSFGVPASPSNYIVPGKMPMSSMTPSLILDSSDNIVFVSGAAGGTRIITSTAFVTLSTLWFDQSLGVATDTARIHNQLLPEDVLYEPHFPEVLIEGLRKKNQKMTLRSANIGVVNSIHSTCAASQTSIFSEKCIHAASDGRKGGAPDGLS